VTVYGIWGFQGSEKLVCDHLCYDTL